MDQYAGNRPIETIDCACYKLECSGIAGGVCELIIEEPVLITVQGNQW